MIKRILIVILFIPFLVLTIIQLLFAVIFWVITNDVPEPVIDKLLFWDFTILKDY